MFLRLYGGALNITVTVTGNEMGDPRSNPGRGCVSLHTNAFRKGMNPVLFFPAFGKIIRQAGLPSFDRTAGLEVEKIITNLLLA